MAVRKRTIQPSIWSDEDFGTISRFSKLIFIGCITQADDEGRLQGNPAVLKSVLFPYNDESDDKISLEDVFDALEEISRKIKNFFLYEIEGKYYIQFLNWKKHQILREDRSLKSVYPAPSRAALSGRRPASDGQVPAEVSKGSKEVIEDINTFSTLKKLRDELEEKGVIKKSKLL